MSAEAALIAIPAAWGIKKLKGEVQKAVDRFLAQVCGVGFEPHEAVRVWLEVVEWKLEQGAISFLRKARETAARPGRILGQLRQLAGKVLHRTVKLFENTPAEQTALVPAFFHSQAKIATALKLGGERGEDGKWRPKPVKRDADGELLDPPGVRHTRDFLEICVKQLGVLERFDRTKEEGHLVAREGRSTVHVLRIPDDAMGFLRELYARWHPGAAKRTAAAAAPKVAAAARAATPAPAATPGPFAPAATAPAEVRKLQAVYLTRHETKYGPLDAAAGRPYAQGDPRIDAEHWPEIAEALKSFAQPALSAALAKGHDLEFEDALAGICEKIVDRYLAGSSPWLDETRHCLAGVWSWSKLTKSREIYSLGPAAAEAWVVWLGDPKPAAPSSPATAAPRLEPEPVDETAPKVEIIDDGRTTETEADRAQARAAAAALRARERCQLDEPAPSCAPDSGPPSEREQDLVAPRRARRGLTPKQLRDLADIEAGRPVRAQKPP